MADEHSDNQSMFRQSALSHITNADELDRYIRVTNPSAWAVLLAVAMILGGILAWSVFADVPTNVRLAGTIRDEEVVCWADESTATKIKEGDAVATVFGEHAITVSVRSVPLSRGEVHELVDSDFVYESLDLDDWNYEVHVILPEGGMQLEKGKVVPVDVTFAEKHPFDLVFGE